MANHQHHSPMPKLIKNGGWFYYQNYFLKT
jgi:hypothetical protein